MQETKANRAGRRAYQLAALLLSAYAVNVIIGKGDVSLGWSLPHANDVTEFLVVLAAMIAFVTGLLRSEAAAKRAAP